MAYTSSLNKKYYNSEDSIVVDFDDDYFYLKTTKKDTIKIASSLITLNRYMR